jgi:prepilin-type processing-associated H-X9-DG protein
MVEGTLAMAGSFLGFSLTDEVLPAFGDTWAVFDAPDHGGILLTGTTIVIEARDADAIGAALARVVELLKPMLAQEDVNLSLRQSDINGRTINTAVIGGVPCPVAPSWTFVDGWMVFGLFPQTVAVAARQVDSKTRGPSILEQPEVEAALKGDLSGEFRWFGYADAEYFARLLYPLGLLWTTAGVSMASQPGIDFDPALYPVLAEAVKDVHNAVITGTADEDGIYYGQVGSANAALVGVAVAALAVSILLPSLSRARQLAKRAVSAANLRGIGQGCHIYANDHQNKFPDSLDELVDGGMIPRETLNSPRDHEGAESYVYISGQTASSDVRNILAYERIFDDEGTNALHVDGHVEWMSIERFKQELSQTYQRLGREDEMPADLRP